MTLNYSFVCWYAIKQAKFSFCTLNIYNYIIDLQLNLQLHYTCSVGLNVYVMFLFKTRRVIHLVWELNVWWCTATGLPRRGPRTLTLSWNVILTRFVPFQSTYHVLLRRMLIADGWYLTYHNTYTLFFCIIFDERNNKLNDILVIIIIIIA